MSNAPYTPQPPSPPPSVAPQPVDYEYLPTTGVRRVLDALEERQVQRIRWGAVIAGLFIAVGTQIVLGLLGVAVGLSAINPASPRPLAGLGVGASLWMGVSSLIALFIGGYSAAKLSGSIRRRDGLLAGLLTWATSLVLTIWLLGAGASAALGGMEVSQAPGIAPGVAPTPERAGQALGETVRRGADEGARAAWGAFGGTVVSLLAAIAGGALGAAGMARHDDAERRMRDREEADRRARARERDREDLQRELLKRG